MFNLGTTKALTYRGSETPFKSSSSVSRPRTESSTSHINLDCNQGLLEFWTLSIFRNSKNKKKTVLRKPVIEVSSF
jgi:hypothetical protein